VPDKKPGQRIKRIPEPTTELMLVIVRRPAGVLPGNFTGFHSGNKQVLFRRFSGPNSLNPKRLVLGVNGLAPILQSKVQIMQLPCSLTD